jgi:VIT1/CCC1 family predicted Fe2+/Mn2+ transporter
MMEQHRTGRAGWLRAAVPGANGGILSTASLVPGVAAAAAGTCSKCRVPCNFCTLRQ